MQLSLLLRTQQQQMLQQLLLLLLLLPPRALVGRCLRCRAGRQRTPAVWPLCHSTPQVLQGRAMQAQEAATLHSTRGVEMHRPMAHTQMARSFRAAAQAAARSIRLVAATTIMSMTALDPHPHTPSSAPLYHACPPLTPSPLSSTPATTFPCHSGSNSSSSSKMQIRPIE